MKKKWIMRFFGIALAATCLFGLVGCNETSGNSGGKEGANAQMAEVNKVINKLAADAGLAPLSMDVSLKPIGALDEVEVASSWSDGKAVFSYTEGDTKVEYIVDTNRENVKIGLIDILTSRNGGEPVLAVTEAGTGYYTGSGKDVSAKRYAAAATVKMKASYKKGHLYLDYTETYDGVSNTKRYDFFMMGKTLAVHVTSPSVKGNNGYANFSTGNSEGLKNPRNDSSIYCEEVAITILDDNSFLSAYVDQAKSFATRIPNMPAVNKTGTTHGMTAMYEMNSAGQTNPLNELFYVTVSDDFLDCAYLTNGEKSEYRDVLNDLVIYDGWNYTTSYSARETNLKSLAEKYGLKDMLLVEHRWQIGTLDQMNPAHYPADPSWGTEAEFKKYITTVKEDMGWKLALHEDYWFMVPGEKNQYWNVDNVEDLIAQEADGTLRYGWQQYSYANLSNMMAEYSKIESALIEKDYNPDASFLDVNGGVHPNVLNQITLNADSKTSRTMAQVVADNALLFKTSREAYKGPVISEGAQGSRSFGSAYAGFLDSGSREITDNYNCEIMVDYELLYIRNKMANQGMGPPARFLTGAKAETFYFDKLNATALAYGHAGFIGDTHYASPLFQDQLIKVYYTFRAIQEEYLNTENKVEEISYFDANGKKMNLNEAVLAGYNFREARLYTRYSNGLEIYLNFAPANWEVTINGHTYVLDQNGYAAENPNTKLVLYSCLVNGKRADFVSCDMYTYANPRGQLVDFGNGLKTGQTVIQTADGSVEIKPSGAVQRDPIKYADLYTGENGANGLTYYYTDGTTLTPFSKVHEGPEKGWNEGNGLLVYPVVAPADNYGCGGISDTHYPVWGYKLEESGVIDVWSWSALQGPTGEHGYTVKIALDTLDNVKASYEVKGDTQTVVNQSFSLEVEAGQELLLIYEPIVWKAEEWFGYMFHVTYTAVYQELPEPILLSKLYTGENGANGLTYYYTSDGKTLTPFTKASEGADKGFVHENGVLVYPVVVPNDNYGCGGSSETEYLAMGYKLPETGIIDLYSWLALQGPTGEHGYTVQVALGTPDNILHQYTLKGDTQSVTANTFALEVEEGQELFILYKPEVWKDNEWFGYITHITYTALT